MILYFIFIYKNSFIPIAIIFKSILKLLHLDNLKNELYILINTIKSKTIIHIESIFKSKLIIYKIIFCINKLNINKIQIYIYINKIKMVFYFIYRYFILLIVFYLSYKLFIQYSFENL